ncbi:hypothetical protein JCM3765_004792 [Sporobolomyces pararoseus]
MAAPSLASKSFYKRPLPSSCIAFNSTEGRQIFANALREDNLNSYFLLSQHFLTQNEPAYCALGTLAMILNALEMDPQRVWKGPWRFYDQDMLDCCRPLSDIAQVGLTLAEFSCLSRCNGLRARVQSPSVVGSPTTESRHSALEQFRNDLKKASKGPEIMAISYSRKVLGQTGTGHFSPVGAYSEKDDKLLILDVARFKYPSYWISTELAYDSMVPIDDATGQPRGYVMLDVAPSKDVGSLAGKQSLTTLTLNKSSWAALSNSLSRLLLETPKSSSLESLVDRILVYLANQPTSAVLARSSPPPHHDSDDSPAPSRPTSPDPSSLDSLLSTLQLSSLPTSPTNPLLTLLLLSLFSSRSSLTALIPPHLSNPLRELFDSILESNQTMKEEVEFLTGQIGALGECCRAEEEGAACPPNQTETTELIAKVRKVKKLVVQQRWFSLELLEGLRDLTNLSLLGPWSPTRIPEETNFVPLRNLRFLSITLHALCDLVDPEYEAHGFLVTFYSIETLSIHQAKVSLTSWLRPRTPPDQNLLSHFPNLALVSSPLSYSSELSGFLPQQSSNSPRTDSINGSARRKAPISILWRMNWQSFVDYMYPYRWFAITDSLSSDSISSLPPTAKITHLAFAPFPYSPIPDHFLVELCNRLRKDPSLRFLRTVWLDVGWEKVGSDEMRLDWDDVLEEKGLKVEFVDMKREGIERWESQVEQEFARGCREPAEVNVDSLPRN